MAQTVWNVKQVEAATRAGREGRHRVAPNLYLQIERPQPGVGPRASWLFRFQIAGGRSRTMGLGGLGDVSLAQARQKAAEALVLVRGGIDPLDARKDAAQALLATQAAAQATARVPTFRQVAEDYMAAHEAGWSAKHGAQWRATLATFVYPAIGNLAVDQVGQDHVLAILKPVWIAKPETAGRIRGRIEVVLDAARVRGHRRGENPAAWRGNLALLLPARGKIAKVKHHAAVGWRDMPRFWAALADRQGTSAAALRFVALTWARSGEVRGMTWGEVDLEQRLWVVPASRMKARAEHAVPLSDAAIAILRDQHQAAAERAGAEPAADDLVFPGRNGHAPLADTAMSDLLVNMQWPGSPTVHGFRSTARDWAAEATMHQREVAEAALAHTSAKGATEAAYARGTMFDKRANLMADWSRYVTSTGGAVVVPLRQVGGGGAA